jgi:ATP phosphoribosyltransferase regulatory subunit
MSQPLQRALLPAGLRDLLPPEAAFEAAVAERLMAAFAAYGYERVKPPLVEFEDSLLAGTGAAMAPHIFRVMDPVSQRMMGVRADMTLQVARIAASRLANAPRPLRLSYAGQVLRVKGDDLRPERQVGQAGAELIGSDAAAADAEAVLLAATSLLAVGVRQLTVDLSSPNLAASVIAAAGITDTKRLRAALDRKDAEAVARLGGKAADTLGALMRAAGPAREALAAMAKLKLPADAAAEAKRVADVVALIEAAKPGFALTIDPVENRDFEYHIGLCFHLFAGDVRGELGRGGRYVAGGEFGSGGTEPATGFTLFMDSLLQALPAAAAPDRLYVPFGTTVETATAWRVKGWIVVAGLAQERDAAQEAKRLNCSHVLVGDKPVKA